VNYYNDNDSFSVKWLKALIAEGLIPEGDVDDRSITEIKPSELDGYTQCHFFAGIGGWPYALRLSGWPEDMPVWTGSCPCQPFSVAGQGKGIKDERHLWPAFRWLIAQKRPATIFGEQVASSDGREWLSGVRLDLETMGYEVGAADLCAAGVGAPHIRQRLFWVADSKHAQRRPSNTAGNQHNRKNTGREKKAGRPTACGTIDHGLGITNSARPQQGSKTAKGTRHRYSSKPACFWSNSIPIPCADGKWRRVPGRVADSTSKGLEGTTGAVLQGRGRGSTWDSSEEHHLEIEPLLFPLADGLPNRVGALRGAGNAIVPQVAAEFIKATGRLSHG
jgi:DNA (cytosine-5)-methyltransferase 1